MRFLSLIDLTCPRAGKDYDVDRYSTNTYGQCMAGSTTKFGRRLKADRLAAKLTVRGLADGAKINYSYVTKLEKSEKAIRVSSSIVVSIANVLGQDELEYLDLAGLVPAPFDKLLSSRGAREFLRTALHAEMTNKEWRKLKEQLESQSIRKKITRSVA